MNQSCLSLVTTYWRSGLILACNFRLRIYCSTAIWTLRLPTSDSAISSHSVSSACICLISLLILNIGDKYARYKICKFYHCPLISFKCAIDFRQQAGYILRQPAVRGARTLPGQEVRRSRGGRMESRRYSLYARFRQPPLRWAEPQGGLAF